MGDRDNERLAIVESAVEYVKQAVGRLEEKFDRFIDHVEEKFASRQEVDSLREEVRELRSKVGRVPPWAASLISVLVTLLAAAMGVHLMH